MKRKISIKETFFHDLKLRLHLNIPQVSQYLGELILMDKHKKITSFWSLHFIKTLAYTRIKHQKFYTKLMLKEEGLVKRKIKIVRKKLTVF